MPFLAPVAAAAFSVGSAIVGAVGAAATAISAIGGATLFTLGGTAITVGGALNAVSAIASIYSMVRKPKLGGAGQDPSANANPIQFKADPDAYIAFVLGVTAVAGNLVYADTRGPKNQELVMIGVLSGAGPIQGIRTVMMDKQTVPWSGSVNGSIGGKYQGKMALNFTEGYSPGADLSYINVPGWTSEHRLSNKATFLWFLTADQKVYPNGKPEPLFVAGGIRVYDPRKDDTRGGSGGQRAGDPATWTFEGFENPYCHALTYLLGYYEKNEVTGKWERVGGVGVPPHAIDWPAFIYGANVADMNNWKISGVINSGMDKWTTLSAMLQAGGGVPTHKGSLVSVLVSAPKVSVATITSADLLDQMTVDTGQLKRDRINMVIPRARNPNANWEVAPYQTIVNEAYLAEDGNIENPREVTVDLAIDQLQVSQIAAYSMVDSRETLQTTMTLGPKFADVRAGDAVTLDIPEAGFNNQKMLVITRKFDPVKFTYMLSLRSETDQKHYWALGQSSIPPVTPGLTARDPYDIPAPAQQTWTITAPLYRKPDGSQIPVIQITGAIDDPTAIGIIINYRQTTRQGGVLVTPNPNPWEQQEFPPSSTLMRIVALPSTEYEVMVRYRYPLGLENPDKATPPVLVTTPALIATDVAMIAGRLAQEAIDQLDAQGDQVRAVEQQALQLIGDFQKLSEANLHAALGRLQLTETYDRLTHYASGQSVAAFAVNEQQQRITADTAFQSNFNLLGALTPDGKAWQLSDTSVFVGPGQSLATWRTQLAAEQAQNLSLIQQEQTARATADSVFTENFQLMGGRTPNGQGWILDQSKVMLSPTESVGSRFNSINVNFGDVRTLISNEQVARANADGVFATNFSLLGGRTANGAGWILDTSKVLVTPTESFGQRLSTITSQIGSVSAQVTNEAQARSSQDSYLASQINSVSGTANGAYSQASQALSVSNQFGAKYGLRLESNNYVTGFIANNNGVQGGFTFLADYFVVSSPNGLVQPFVIWNGNVYMPNVYVRKLEAQTVITETIVANNISQTYYSTRGYMQGPIAGRPFVNSIGANVRGPWVNINCFIQIQGNGGSIGHQMYLFCDGVHVASAGTYSFGGHMNSIYLPFRMNLSGWHTWDIQVSQSSGGGTYYVVYTSIEIEDRKTEG